MISDDMGLYGVMDVESQSKAPRLAWINRIFTSSRRADIANQYFEKVRSLSFLLRCYPSVELLPYTSKFYSELLRYAADTFVSQNEVYILWNNKCIQIDN